MPMKSVSVTYKAPPGDSKVTEVFGHTFFDGKAETVTVDERVLGKLQGNRHFKCSEPQDAKDEAPDPKQQKAADEKALADEKAKREAQGEPPPLRGAVHRPEKTDEEKADDEKREAQKHPANTQGTSGGAPDPNQPQAPKQTIPGEAKPAPQAGRDH